MLFSEALLWERSSVFTTLYFFLFLWKFSLDRSPFVLLVWKFYIFSPSLVIHTLVPNCSRLTHVINLISQMCQLIYPFHLFPEQDKYISTLSSSLVSLSAPHLRCYHLEPQLWNYRCLFNICEFVLFFKVLIFAFLRQ